MSDIREHVAYLSQNIGPRPAGTEEEQQAALYLAKAIQGKSGLYAGVEDFNYNARFNAISPACGVVSIVMAVLAIALPPMVIPALIVTALAAALYVLCICKPSLIANLSQTGMSQNVVAKYEVAPNTMRRGRRRKVVLVAHYDSGKVQRELTSPVFSVLKQIHWAELGAMMLVPVLLLVRLISHASGAGLVVLDVLMAVCAVVALLPLVAALVHRGSAFSDGANANASGVAVLVEAAARVGQGRVVVDKNGSDAEAATIHGEEAVRAAGYVGDGVELVYEEGSGQAGGFDAYGLEGSLPGRPFGMDVQTAVPSNGMEAVPSEESVIASDDRACGQGEFEDGVVAGVPESGAAGASAVNLPAVSAVPAVLVAPVSVPAPATGASQTSAPSWFVAAQEKARKSEEPAAPAKRSRYADALDAAVYSASAAASYIGTEKPTEVEARLRHMREGILGTQEPDADEGAQAAPLEQREQDEGEKTQGQEQAAEQSGDAALAPNGGQSQQVQPEQDASTSSEEPSKGLDGIVSSADLEELKSSQIEDIPDFEVPWAKEAETMAAADRTISFIPVEVDGEALRQEVMGQASQQDDQSVSLQGQGEEDSASARETPAADAQGGGQKSTPVIRKKRAIDLPSVTGNLEPLEEHKQRAPLADRAEGLDGSNASKSARIRGLRTAVPTIGNTGEIGGTAVSQASLRESLPSLSGALEPEEVAALADAPDETTAVSQVGSFAPVGATGAFAPVGDELLDDVAPENIYVEDADDSAYDENFTETGAFAGPGYVDMPKSRVSRLFGRLHRKDKKKNEETTAQEWLDVDESFEAREVGRARGGWESFRAEDDEFDASAGYQDDDCQYDEPDGCSESGDYAQGDHDDGSRQAAPRNWYGGGFSGKDLEKATPDAVSPVSPNIAPAAGTGEAPAPAAHSDDASELANMAEEPLLPPDSAGQAKPDETQEALAHDEAAYVATIDAIHEFKNPSINTDVWFVALGAELANNSGMEAFIAEHAEELKGSIIIDLDGLGAGKLTLIETEGMYRTRKVSARMKRFTRKASSATGLAVASGNYTWRESAAACAMRHGFQAMHLVGMEGGKPAFFGEEDDVLDNVDEKKLAAHADYVMQILRSI